MVKNHLKRLATPRTWDIRRKENKFIVRPAAGGSLEHSMPILVLLRDMLEKAKTLKETKYVLQNKEVLLNGKRVIQHDATVGLMDVLSIPETQESYRMLLNKKGKLMLLPIDGGDGNVLLYKVINKSVVKGGGIQLNFSGGTNLLSKDTKCMTGDVMVFHLPDKAVKDIIKLEKGTMVYLTGGKHMGHTARVEEIKGEKLSLKSDEGDSFETSKKYAFAVGKDKPVIRLSK